VASSWRSHGDDAEDGRVDVMRCVRLFYPNFIIFIVVGPTLQETAKSTRAKTLVDKDQALVDNLSNLRRGPRRLSNLRRWTWAVVG
jgi:hypothetical protein